MVRVIKGQKDPQVSTASTEQDVQVAEQPRSGARIIDRELYRADKVAKEIEEGLEKEKELRYMKGRKKAQQAKEEAAAKAANEVFGQLSKEALMIFRERAATCLEAKEDLTILSLEIVEKILGTKVQVDVVPFVHDGIEALRMMRRLKIQLPLERLASVSDAMKNGFSYVQWEAAEDLSPGFARVSTDVGSALCEEETLKRILANFEEKSS